MAYPYIKAFEDRPKPKLMSAVAIQTKLMPLMEQEAPFQARELHTEFCTDWAKSNKKYFKKRQTVTGVVMWMGEDIHHKHAIQLSDRADGDCYVHCVLISEKEYGDVKVGDTIICQGNYLECHVEFGVVLKYSKMIK